ncbi:MAG: carbamoyl-phosphate synthase large subunit [Deltaproteobacteria bacterium]|nr:carbamoyl-phosphate synthase large subunit [Deltaproteobacteria bacterium]
MPKRTDIHKILIIGSGPIVIGQACEFDYSGTQACKALKKEGFEIVLVNSNPATIMTDPQVADRTYIEPLNISFLEKIIEKEKPDALLPTLGGQTALNLARALAKSSFLQKHGVSLLGASLSAIEKAEDRELFKKAMQEIGLQVPHSFTVKSLAEAYRALNHLNFPLVIRPSYTLGGMGGSIVYNSQEFSEYLQWGFNQSPVHEVLVEESVLGWKEFELEVMRDKADNVIIVCSIENFDPMGVHTGDSITIAPQQTLSDKEYQVLREAAKKIIRKIGVETGGSNIQFAVHPETGKMVVIEMNPRVSRSSALASKATGFPIAKIAALLAVGYTLPEIQNDITLKTPACFEPVLDYVVTKIPRFNFEKFPLTPQVLTTQMKSVGEVMAIGRTFKESLGKALQSLEVSVPSFCDLSKNQIKEQLNIPSHKRIWLIYEAFRKGVSVEEVAHLSKIDPWFLYHVEECVGLENVIAHHKICRDWKDIFAHSDSAPRERHSRSLPAVRTRRKNTSQSFSNFVSLLKQAKQWGFSDAHVAKLCHQSPQDIESLRICENIQPVYKVIDTCAGEFESYTPYLYSTYDDEDESKISSKEKVVIIGSGPNRIGQGIEFDYCCVHAVMALKGMGYETIMINCNPETVSTDYDTADKLYFEPLTFEHVLPILKLENPCGVIVQLGGQTPLKLAQEIERAGFKILGTTVATIMSCENREFFSSIVEELGLRQPQHETATSKEQACDAAEKLAFPLVVRPSFVLGGQSMEIIYDMDNMKRYLSVAFEGSSDNPLLLDRYIENATEVDVDVLCDGKDVYIAGVLEHVEEAGVHSGDSSCSLPGFSLSESKIKKLEEQATAIAKKLQICGLMNIQFALLSDSIYVLEVNPRASRTIPFIAKVTGLPLVKIATELMMGRPLSLRGVPWATRESIPFFAVKRSVFPFIKYPHEDCILGPQMKSTGEIMAIEKSFPMAFAKAAQAVDSPLPSEGAVFISVKNEDKSQAFEVAAELLKLGFSITATRGTCEYFKSKGLHSVASINKVLEGRPHIVDALKSRALHLVINTTKGEQALRDSFDIRRCSLELNIPYFTTISAGLCAVQAIQAMKQRDFEIFCLQDLHTLTY